jgi:anaerobic dimethyl sulfoxide reductase subunit A
MTQTNERIIPTTCHSHCGGTCPLRVHVKEGAITRIETDDEYRACLKGRAYRQRVYSPDRLKYPLKRCGEKGNGKYTRISWDEALDTVAGKLKEVKSRYGPEAILYLASVGDVNWLHNPGLMERLLALFGGYSSTWGSASGEGGVWASFGSYGINSTAHSRSDFLNSRLIIMWGWNPVVGIRFGNTPLFLDEARARGARIVTVDPRFTDSAAALADQWIPIRPGTDAAMLIAMAYVVVVEKLEDRAFIEKNTFGFEAYRDHLLGKTDHQPKTPAWAETITGVPAATIVSLAQEVATRRPTALMDSFAPGRTAYGEQFHRAAMALTAITGNIGVPGTNAPGTAALGDVFPPVHFGMPAWMQLSNAPNPVDAARPDRPNAFFYKGMPANFYQGGGSSSRVNRFYIADAILKGKKGGYPTDYKMAYVVNFNYVNQYANSNKIARALKSLEFMAIQDQFLTATARLADIILPVNSILERNDLTSGGSGPFLGYMNRAIASLDESKSHWEIASALAERLGVPWPSKTEEEWLSEEVGKARDIPDPAAFRHEGIQRVNLPKPYVCFEPQVSGAPGARFMTPSGKMEIYSQGFASLNNPSLPPLPTYIEAWEGPADPLRSKYPLQVVTTHTRRRAHTQFEMVPWLRELYPQAAGIHPSDAALRGIHDGDMVRVFNGRGQLILPAQVTGRIMPGVIDIPQGAWYAPDARGIDRGGCANTLTNDVTSPAGAFASNQILAQVEKAG